MESCNKGREYARIRAERNKYKRLYFKYVRDRCKIKSNEKQSKFLDIDQKNPQDQTNSTNKNDILDKDNDYDDDYDDSFVDVDDDEYEIFEEEEEEMCDIEESNSILDLDIPELRDLIIIDLLHNLGKGHGARYLNETKIYSYELYCKSPSAYRFLLKLFQFPSESILHKKFDSKVNSHQKSLTNLADLNNILDNQKNVYSLKDEKIDTVLAVDAFAATILKKINNEKINDNPDKHIFMFLFCPIMTKIKPFISHLHASKSGNADTAIDNKIGQIKIKSKFSNFRIKYISFDGDAHYSKFFKDQFDKLFVLYKENDLDAFNIKFEELLPLFITDPLHIWKNLRTRLFFKIVINPFVSSNSVTASQLDAVLHLGPILSDKSQVAKMNDDFAIGLFNFKNSLKLLNDYTKESFFYIFLVALWVEALLNIHLSPDSRIYLINILLRIFSTIYTVLTKQSLPNTISFKKSAHNDFITICTIEKIQRIFPTLLATRYEICMHKKDKSISLSRLGTHCAENKIGNVRSLSHQDQSIENLFHVSARYDFIKSLTKASDDPRKKRLNQGGVRLDVGDVDLPFDVPSEIVADFLLFKLGFIDEFDESIFDIEKLKQNLEIIVETAPYNPKVSFSSTKNHKIVDRYYSLPTSHDYFPLITQKHIWTRDEINLIDSCLSTGCEKELYKFLNYIPKTCLTHFISQRKTIFANRALQTHELYLFNLLYRKGVNFKDIASVLPCRTAQSLKNSFYYIKTY